MNDCKICDVLLPQAGFTLLVLEGCVTAFTHRWAELPRGWAGRLSSAPLPALVTGAPVRPRLQSRFLRIWLYFYHCALGSLSGSVLSALIVSYQRTCGGRDWQAVGVRFILAPSLGSWLLTSPASVAPSF